MDAELTALSHSLVVELAGSIGLRDSRLAQSIMWPIFRPATDALARIGLTFDRNMLQYGFSRAMGIALEDFASDVRVRGAGAIPNAGPLLVLSNHPGTYDSLVIASQLGRDDLNFISGDIPFLRALPRAHEHFYCISEQGNGRMLAVRQGLRHLHNNGALMIFGLGHIEPDPAVYDDASSLIDHWSSSVDLFLNAVPGTCLLLSIVSNVVAPKWRNSILYHLRKAPLDRRRLVEFGQVIHQMLFPRHLRTVPAITFAPPVGLDELRQETGSERVLPAVIARSKALLADHMNWVGTFEK